MEAHKLASNLDADFESQYLTKPDQNKVVKLIF